LEFSGAYTEFIFILSPYLLDGYEPEQRLEISFLLKTNYNQTMRKALITLLVLCVISVTGAGAYIYRDRLYTKPSASQTPTPSPTPIVYTYSKTTYFAAVTGFKSKHITLTSEDFKKLETVYVVAKDSETIKNLDYMKGVKFTVLENPDELIKIMNSKDTDIGVLNIDDLSYKVKTLLIENKFIFDKSLDLATYPLKSNISLTAAQKTEDQVNFTQPRLTKLGHTGSMISARGIQYNIEKKFKSDFTLPFKSTKPLFDTFDFLSSTFETPVVGEGKPCDSCFTFVGPEKFLEGVKYSGIDFFSMASNHIMDGGVSGLKNTQTKLDELGLKYNGASTINNDDAGKPVLVEVNGLKIAYVSFNDTPGRGQWATATTPGAASISDWDVDAQGRTTRYQPNEERIKYFLQRARDLKPDFVFVIMHWSGQEYINEPLDYTKRLGVLLKKYGADMILGDHPHWVAKVDFSDDKPIFYSVGNFIFDQMWSTETRQGMTIELNYLDKKLVNVRLHPHELDLYKQGQVILMTPKDPGYQQTLDRVWEVSDFKGL
jgi:hypothetical protein